MLESDISIMRSQARYELNQANFNCGRHLSPADIFISKTETLTKGAIEGTIDDVDLLTSNQLHEQADQILDDMGCQLKIHTNV